MAPLSLHLLPHARPSLPLRHSVGGPSAASLSLVPWRWQWSRTGGAPRRLPRTVSAADTPRLLAEEAQAPAVGEERFDWLDQWYPVAPVCDLDKRKPHGKMVMGLSVVAWFDGGGEWRVVDDACPHRLAPLSEGRVDDKGRLQCAYHGWCFDGCGSCKFIPQAPALGPPVHKNSKACVASYPSVVQNNILWFYPRSEPEYRDVLQRKRPPYIPDIDDPSFNTIFAAAELDHGNAVVFDREGGLPVDMNIVEANIDGFMSNKNDDWGYFKFVAPYTILGMPFRKEPVVDEGKKKKHPEVSVVFFCVPVAPGRSRMIAAFPWSVGVWSNKMMPRWLYHITLNNVLDSDTHLLHIEERNFAAVGLDNWHKACYVPTSSDKVVIAFRNWFRKYCNHQIGWLTSTVNQPPLAYTRVQLFERYWSHVKQCTSCSSALKGMKALEVALQVASVAIVGFLAAGKGTVVTSAVQRAAVVGAAVLCFAAS
uniref:Rieske domain-containing protein n=1 Tax=Oryza punctata TaxID=4537 RepID=A0A0E0KKF7_ORYPU